MARSFEDIVYYLLVSSSKENFETIKKDSKSPIPGGFNFPALITYKLCQLLNYHSKISQCIAYSYSYSSLKYQIALHFLGCYKFQEKQQNSTWHNELEEKQHISKRIPFYFLHNIVKTPLAITLAIETALFWYGLKLWHQENLIAKGLSLLLFISYIVVRLINFALSLTIEPLALCQRAWRCHPVLGVMSAILSTTIYAVACPLVLLKFAPVVMKTIASKVSIATSINTATTALKVAVTGALFAVPFLLRGVISLLKMSYCKRHDQRRQSETQSSSYDEENSDNTIAEYYEESKREHVTYIASPV